MADKNTRRSFKEYYEVDKEKAPKEVVEAEELDAQEAEQDQEVEKIEEDEPAISSEPSRFITVLETDTAEEQAQVLVEDVIREALQEQHLLTEKMLDAMTHANSEIASSVTESISSLVKDTVSVNEKLTDAIVLLSEKVELLEEKVEALKDLELPTPIVHMSYPNKTKKIVHRDKKGLIDHITEEVIPDSDDSEQD